MEGRRYEIKFDNRIERAFERCSNVVRMLLKTRMESREIKRGINLGRLSFSLNCHIGHKR